MFKSRVELARFTIKVISHGFDTNVYEQNIKLAQFAIKINQRDFGKRKMFPFNAKSALFAIKINLRESDTKVCELNRSHSFALEIVNEQSRNPPIHNQKYIT